MWIKLGLDAADLEAKSVNMSYEELQNTDAMFFYHNILMSRIMHAYSDIPFKWWW